MVNKQYKLVVLVLFSFIFMTSCQSLNPDHIRAVDQTFDHWDSSEEESMTSTGASDGPNAGNSKRQPTVLLPSEISNALLPPLKVELGNSKSGLLESRFDLKVENSPVRAVLMSLVKGTRHNMVVHPSVQGDISLSLKNVTVDEVMDTLRNVYGYEYTRTSSGYEVRESKVKTRIFKIDYLNVSREGTSEIKVSSGQLTETNTASDSSSSEKDASSGQSGDLASSKVTTHTKSSFWDELGGALNAIVGEEDGRKVIINPHAGIIVVRALPKELREVEEYLSATQNIIQRQVIIEAKILEVELSEGFQSGINWAGVVRSGNGIGTIGQTGGGTIFKDDGVSEIAGNTGILDPSGLTAVSGTNTSAFGGVFSLALDFTNFNTFIELLQTQGDVHVLSSPRVSTLNNQKAVIKVGFDEFFVTGLRSDTTESAATTTQSIEVDLTPFFSGVALDVMPQIDEHGAVTLHIHPSVSKVTERNKEVRINSKDGINLPLALSAIRESDSIVKAESGQVIIIGGLMQELVKNESASIPWLGDIPILGALFRHENNRKVKSELVILLKPIVIESSEQWSSHVSQRKESMKTISLFPPKNLNMDSTRDVKPVDMAQQEKELVSE